MTEDEEARIAGEIGELHAQTREAFERRDVIAYCSFFTEDVQYIQPDGKTIGLGKLKQQIADQFDRVSEAEWAWVREELVIPSAEAATEKLSMTIDATVTAFAFVKVRWRTERRATFEYKKTADRWQVCRVAVHEEKAQRLSTRDSQS